MNLQDARCNNKDTFLCILVYTFLDERLRQNFVSCLISEGVCSYNVDSMGITRKLLLNSTISEGNYRFQGFVVTILLQVWMGMVAR